MRLTRLAHGVNELSQEKPSGSLNTAVGRYTPSCRTATPGWKRVWPGGSDLGLRGWWLRLAGHCRWPLAALARPRGGPGRRGTPPPRRAIVPP
ncbi:hypothetical protein STAFG_6542 [Streptomyces afghaniensis 772]|uniref:Uncharacterized protein n=1 Tax=Streptomyces afghaniensis 772 TaxID=1283301 RepID=S4MIK7_9ACTN|nr:hypothetical protein STAFG_6542 [Streptomyces afghaniensis 772]